MKNSIFTTIYSRFKILVRRLEGQGVPSKQAEAITSAITEVLNDSLENVAQSFVSKGEMQRIEMTQDGNLGKFKSSTKLSDAPGGKPIMQQSLLERPQRHRPGIGDRLKDDRDFRRDRNNGGNRFDKGENPDSSDGGGHEDQMFDSFSGQGVHAQFPSDVPPPSVLMPVPGAGPLGPFIPAPPEVAMRMMRDQGGPSPFEGGGRNVLARLR